MHWRKTSDERRATTFGGQNIMSKWIWLSAGLLAGGIALKTQFC